MKITFKDFLTEELNTNFWKWFGNSKVVDKNGNPLIVYHGSQSSFKIFKPSKSVGNHGEKDQIEGIYFTDNKDGASFFSLVDDDNYLKPVYLSIKNPYIVEDNNTLKTNLNVDKLADVNKKLQSMGYDGIIMERGFYARGGPHKLYLAFYPNQIKSIHNNGQFDINSSNIFESFNGNFWKWFGNSKVVDENGNPLTLYHGTNQNIEEFKYGIFGYHFGNKEQADLIANNKSNPTIIPVYLKMENPLYTVDFIRWDAYPMAKLLYKQGVLSEKDSLYIQNIHDGNTANKSLIKLLKKLGYDGIIYENQFEGDGLSYVVFDSNQIKSAIGNNGEYSLTSNNIYESVMENGYFQYWFKDSKVVDDNGNPKVVYHGSSSEFDNFEGVNYFTDDYFNADGYANGNYVYDVYLSIKNPLIIDCHNKKWDNLETPYGKTTRNVVENVDNTKYDGVIFTNIKDSWIDDEDYQDASTVYVTFSPNQIKSAIDNNGYYSLESDNIFESSIKNNKMKFLNENKDQDVLYDNLNKDLVILFSKLEKDDEYFFTIKDIRLSMLLRDICNIYTLGEYRKDHFELIQNSDLYKDLEKIWNKYKNNDFFRNKMLSKIDIILDKYINTLNKKNKDYELIDDLRSIMKISTKSLSAQGSHQIELNDSRFENIIFTITNSGWIRIYMEDFKKIINTNFYKELYDIWNKYKSEISSKDDDILKQVSEKIDSILRKYTYKIKNNENNL